MKLTEVKFEARMLEEKSGKFKTKGNVFYKVTLIEYTINRKHTDWRIQLLVPSLRVHCDIEPRVSFGQGLDLPKLHDDGASIDVKSPAEAFRRKVYEEVISRMDEVEQYKKSTPHSRDKYLSLSLDGSSNAETAARLEAGFRELVRNVVQKYHPNRA